LFDLTPNICTQGYRRLELVVALTRSMAGPSVYHIALLAVNFARARIQITTKEIYNDSEQF